MITMAKYLLTGGVGAAGDGGERQLVEHHVVATFMLGLLIEDEDVTVVGLLESGIG